MSKNGSREEVVPQEVTALIDERQQIQGWISRLDEYRGETSPEVFEKVFQDYTTRLEELNAKLERHRAELQASLDERRGRLSEMQGERDGRGAELEEAKLRYSVGELSEAQWNRRKDEGESALEGLDSGLDSDRSAVAELQAALANLEGDAPAEDLGLAAPVASLPWTLEEEGQPVSRLKGETLSIAPEGLADEGSMAEGPTAESPAESLPAEPPAATVTGPRLESDALERSTPAEPGPADTAELGANGDYLDELEFLESLSLDDADRFDAVSAMLDDDDDEGEASGEEETST